MKAPARWPLATLLEVARRRELAARIGLAGALAEVARRRGDEDSAREALRAHRAASAELARSAPGGEVVVAALGGGAHHAARRGDEERHLATTVRRREAAHGEALDEAERRRLVLAEARAALGALEGRREAWRAARARDRALAEEDAVDEIVSAR